MQDTNKPWENEPDELRFIDEETGLECIIWRNLDLGMLCGYVVFPEGKEWNLDDIDVHWGITFNGVLEDYDNKHAIGFDCGHGGDLIPYLSRDSKDRFYYLRRETYRDIEYVKAECKKLAKQLYDLRESKKE